LDTIKADVKFNQVFIKGVGKQTQHVMDTLTSYNQGVFSSFSEGVLIAGELGDSEINVGR